MWRSGAALARRERVRDRAHQLRPRGLRRQRRGRSGGCGARRGGQCARGCSDRAGRDRGRARRAGADPPARRGARRRRAPPRPFGSGGIGNAARRSPGGGGARSRRPQRRGGLRRRRPARARGRARGGRGHPQALGRPAHRWRAQLLLAGGRARRPPGCAFAGDPASDAGSRGRVPRRRGGAVPARLRGGAHAESLRALQRRAPHRRDDRARRPARGGEARHRATTRRSRTTDRGHCWRGRPTEPRTRPTCSRPWRRSRWRGCASRSPI